MYYCFKFATVWYLLETAILTGFLRAALYNFYTLFVIVAEKRYVVLF
jgi:hypothetical protein